MKFDELLPEVLPVLAEVVALVGNENTLKRYFVDKENQKIRLHPENKTMKDIIVSDCEIQGVAVKVIKDLA